MFTCLVDDLLVAILYRHEALVELGRRYHCFRQNSNQQPDNLAPCVQPQHFDCYLYLKVIELSIAL